MILAISVTNFDPRVTSSDSRPDDRLVEKKLKRFKIRRKSCICLTESGKSRDGIGGRVIKIDDETGVWESQFQARACSPEATGRKAPLRRPLPHRGKSPLSAAASFCSAIFATRCPSTIRGPSIRTAASITAS
jgi:hypothetical protein